MSALPARRLHPRPGDGSNAKGTPFLKLHRCRLDYDAALRERLRGGCAARVARAAGSRARSRRNLRRVGLKIVKRLESRYDVLATFDQLGYTIGDFCRGLIEQLYATRTRIFCYRGRCIESRPFPDWRARARAAMVYLRATGILDLPP